MSSTSCEPRTSNVSNRSRRGTLRLTNRLKARNTLCKCRKRTSRPERNSRMQVSTTLPTAEACSHQESNCRLLSSSKACSHSMMMKPRRRRPPIALARHSQTSRPSRERRSSRHAVKDSRLNSRAMSRRNSWMIDSWISHHQRWTLTRRLSQRAQ